MKTDRETRLLSSKYLGTQQNPNIKLPVKEARLQWPSPPGPVTPSSEVEGGAACDEQPQEPTVPEGSAGERQGRDVGPERVQALPFARLPEA